MRPVSEAGHGVTIQDRSWPLFAPGHPALVSLIFKRVWLFMQCEHFPGALLFVAVYSVIPVFCYYFFLQILPSVPFLFSLTLFRTPEYQWIVDRSQQMAPSQYKVGKVRSFQVWDFHYQDNTVARPSYLYNGNHYTAKTASVETAPAC